MVAAGLLSFGRRIHAERPVESGLRLVALLRRELEEDPTFSPTLSRSSASERRAWSTHGRAHLAKIVQALLLGEDGSDRAATRLIEHVKRLQHDDGHIETGPEPETMLHPHLYAAEGLWIRYLDEGTFRYNHGSTKSGAGVRLDKGKRMKSSQQFTTEEDLVELSKQGYFTIMLDENLRVLEPALEDDGFKVVVPQPGLADADLKRQALLWKCRKA